MSVIWTEVTSTVPEALLATTNSPYVEVRANVDPDDDPAMPVSTVRAWFIGVVFCCAGTFIDTLFAFRQPSISVGVNVAQFTRMVRLS